MRPGVQVTCLDSVQKRMRFVDTACGVAGISNVRTLWGRCEDLGQDKKLRGAFDVVTARAVASTATLAEFCMPFAAVGGVWVAAKGPTIEVRCSPADLPPLPVVGLFPSIRMLSLLLDCAKLEAHFMSSRARRRLRSSACPLRLPAA